MAEVLGKRQGQYVFDQISSLFCSFCFHLEFLLNFMAIYSTTPGASMYALDAHCQTPLLIPVPLKFLVLMTQQGAVMFCSYSRNPL